jgi:hypothetical protein
MTTYKIMVWIIESVLQKIEQGLTQNTERINLLIWFRLVKNCSAPFSHMIKKQIIFASGINIESGRRVPYFFSEPPHRPSSVETYYDP